MKIRCLDFETTGQADDKAKGKAVGVVEIGWTDVYDDGRIAQPQAHLVNPGIPIPPEARAIHHLHDGMLVDAIDPSRAFMLLMNEMEVGDAFCAHNAPFERVFFGGGSFPWICTMNCAKHLYEDAPSYSNQALRYYLDLESELEWPEMAMPPHRAGPDSYVTAHLVRRMMRERTVLQLVELTSTPVLLKYIPFEKHQGKLWADADRGLLEWVLDPKRDNMKPEVLHTARYWLSQMRRQSNPFG